MKEVPKIRVLIEIPILRKDGTLDVTRCFADSIRVRPGLGVEAAMRRCVGRALKNALEDFKRK